MVTTFNGKDCKVQIYIDASVAGVDPTLYGNTWDTDSQVIAVATSVDVNTSKEITPHHGLNHATPQILKEGNITYDFSIDSLYTTASYGSTDMVDLINESKTFASKLTVMDDDNVEVAGVVLTYCKCSSDNLSLSDDGDLTCSLSGQSTTRTMTTA